MTSTISIRLLGTGTSQGIPVIGCRCPVCTSADSRDQRLRTAGLVRVKSVGLAIDIGPDFRQQLLAARVDDIHAVLLTHEHNDHVSGLDDIRPVNFLHRRDIPLYGLPRTLGEIEQRFAYAFDPEYHYPGKPRVYTVPVGEDPFSIHGVLIEPIPAFHGDMSVVGYRIGPVAYLTDVKELPESSQARLQGLEVLVLNALHRRPHPTHLNLEEAVELAERLRPGRCLLTHISHDMGTHEAVSRELPARVELGYDGLEVEIPISS